MSEKKNGRKRCWIIVIFDVTGLLPTDQTIGYITMALVCEETFDVNSKITQTTQNI